MERLNDLETITHGVRTARSRENIKEAINAYYGGAYRSSIVSTWIAVADDIIEKLRELAAYEDPQAIVLTENLEGKIKARNIPALQKFEESLLELAEKEFELIGPEQRTNLERIKQDRNFCAHPAYTLAGTLFDPTPELVRTHITHAVLDLLKHSPVRGKSSLKVILEDIKGEGFPATTPKVAGTYICTKYLEYAKRSLIDNLLGLLIKAFTKRLPDWQGHSDRAFLVLLGIAEVKAEIFETWARENFARIASQLSGNEIYRVFGLLAQDIRFWGWLGEAQKVQLTDFFSKTRVPSMPRTPRERLEGTFSWGDFFEGLGDLAIGIQQKEFLNKLGLKELGDLFRLMRIDALKKPLFEVFNALSQDDKIEVISKSPTSDIMSEALNLFAGATSFRHAEHLGQNILPAMARYMSTDDIMLTQKIVLENGQIYAASGTCGVLMDWLSELSKRQDINLKQIADWAGFYEELEEQYDNYDQLKQHLCDLQLVAA